MLAHFWFYLLPNKHENLHVLDSLRVSYFWIKLPRFSRPYSLQPTNYCLLRTNYYLSPTTDYLLRPTTYCLLLTTFYILVIRLLMVSCSRLMAQGQWLMAQGLWLKAHGSWLRKTTLAPGLPGLGPLAANCVVSHKP